MWRRRQVEKSTYPLQEVEDFLRRLASGIVFRRPERRRDRPVISPGLGEVARRSGDALFFEIGPRLLGLAYLRFDGIEDNRSRLLLRSRHIDRLFDELQVLHRRPTR